MDKNHDDLALVLVIAGLSISLLNIPVALGILPLFTYFILAPTNVLNILGLLLGIFSRKTSEHEWKFTLILILFIIGVVIQTITGIPIGIKLSNRIFGLFSPYIYP